MKKKYRYIILASVVLCAVGFSGCGVSHKSPEKVVKSLIEAYAQGKEKKIKDCYGAKKETDENLQKQIDATLKYFEVHEAEKVEIQECNVLSETEEYSYVYILYDFVLDNKNSYPCINTYMVGKEDKKYYVLAPEKVTEEMSKEAATEYSDFMTTDTYKNYVTRYETFIKKNPGYEEKIAGKLS